MSDEFYLEYYDPPAELSQHLLALFHFEWDRDEIIDRHPGALGQFVFFARGTGEMYVGDKTLEVQGYAHLFAGFERPHLFRMDGPWHAIGASLSALGWAALTGAPADENFDRFISPGELLGPGADEFVAEYAAKYRSGAISGRQLCDEIARWLAPRLNPVSQPHKELIGRVYSWLGTSLNPDMDKLFEALPYSRRQTERLVARFFGLPPRRLARRYRAVRAASLLAQPELTDEAEAEIAAAFYDQPHMIREIRHYCGFTPSRLGGEEAPLFHTMVRMKNIERISDFRRIGEGR